MGRHAYNPPCLRAERVGVDDAMSAAPPGITGGGHVVYLRRCALAVGATVLRCQTGGVDADAPQGQVRLFHDVSRTGCLWVGGTRRVTLQAPQDPNVKGGPDRSRWGGPGPSWQDHLEWTSRMAVLIGHRGACGHAPENTLASLRKARALGVDWVEFDVRLTADGVPVLLHDETLDRTTDAIGAVSDYSRASLGEVDAGRWYGDGFVGERLPDLTEAIEVLAAEGLRANVEIKHSTGRESATAAATARELLRCWPADSPPPLLSSFAPACLSAAREAAPDLRRALLFEAVPDDWREQVRSLGCEGLHCHYGAATPELVSAVRGEGLACRVYTVNEVRRASELAAAGVDGIVTDYPDRLAPAVRPDSR